MIIGIDPSLTATGIARIDQADPDIETWTVTSSGRKTATIHERAHRLQSLTQQISAACTNATLVVIEYPTLSQVRQGGHLDRHGLWWLLVTHLITNHIPVAVVTASGRAKYATGRGNAGKDEVMLAVARRYLNAIPANNNEADALILAAMGARHTGHPIEEHLPKTHLAAMDAIPWPEAAAIG